MLFCGMVGLGLGGQSTSALFFEFYAFVRARNKPMQCSNTENIYSDNNLCLGQA